MDFKNVVIHRLTVVKENDYKFVIKEPGKIAVTFRKIYTAEFCSRAEKLTPLKVMRIANQKHQLTGYLRTKISKKGQ